MDEALAQSLARNWEDGWNSVDLAKVMGDLADDVVFSSPFVSRMTGDPATTSIDGYPAVEAYMRDALQRAGRVRYVLDATYVGADSVIIAYTCKVPDGPDRTGSDIMIVNDDGKVVDWRSHYTFAPDDAPELVTD